ncbi:hypothetical protein PsAD2_00247 [Pseudovibrio axinellae]|uniref:DUF2155 domain-containing protein n=1 Tax=Pseudovibrio axinellae TaxID=989403 RepID=A0A166B1W0_9HYPH|nr:DUF2155 domain-containing protein [Pseudovibrio axinellae]KZL21821.1 hypothetical protein PsAD2_00247 [Pseudovibrio axinellae]SEQ79777.1 hypothetical protein SAMN05421798_104241 [Pseudovibrio axinellae]
MDFTMRRYLGRAAFCAFAAFIGGAAFSLPLQAQTPIKNPVAVFKGLDKITGRITTFDVYIDETVQFGALQVTPRVCNSRPRTEASQTTAFIEVDELTLDSKVRRIFSGWMFASNPGVHAVEHSVYDIWLINCKTKTSVPPPEGYSGPAVDLVAEADPLAGEDFVSSGEIPVPRPKRLAILQ